MELNYENEGGNEDAVRTNKSDGEARGEMGAAAKIAKGGIPVARPLPRYNADSINVDMSLPDNHFRYLQHIDLVKNAENEQIKIKVDDVEILFPMKPYQVQIDYMEKVVESCKKGANALLESPTGTGKTLCLLTATLAWLKQTREFSAMDENNLPKIIYCSRTHS